MSKIDTQIVENGFFNCKLTVKDGEDLTISVRPDGFVNATQLCKAGGKQFKHWNSIEKTRTFLQVLTTSTGIPVLELIKMNAGEKHTWVHPQVAINIAQWISPEFELQVKKNIDELKIKEQEQEQEQKQLQISNLNLGNGFIIENRLEDGYINVTSLCKAGGKQFKSWNRLDKTRSFLQVLSTSVKIHTDLLIKMNIGGLNEDRKTWVHPQVAINIAQWISPDFDVKVSAWIYELVLTGKVELGKEKSNDELLKLQQELLLKDELINTITIDHKSLISDHKILQNNHNNILKRRNRTDFDYGNVIYIISHPAFIAYYNADYYKIGKSSQTKDEPEACFKHRLGTYNTGAPVDYTVHYLLYVEDNDYVEKSLKLSYALKLNPSNKEWIKDVKLADIIDFLRKLCVLLNIAHKEVVFENISEIENEPKVVEEEEVIEEEEEEEVIEEEVVKEEVVKEEVVKEEVVEEEEVPNRVCKKCSKKKNIDMFKRHGRGYSLSCLECDKPYKRPTGTCIECKASIADKRAERCVACAKKASRLVVDRPSYVQLKRDLENMSYVACGKKYGVSDNSIRKWIRVYEGKPTKPVFKV